MRELIPPHKRTVELTFEIFTVKKMIKNLLTHNINSVRIHLIKAKTL